MRVVLTDDIYTDRKEGWLGRGVWPAHWVAPRPDPKVGPVINAYRLRFQNDHERTVRVHVSADERYRLFLDGRLLGCGPERGDVNNWFFETYDLPLTAGPHVLVAQVWSPGADGPAPYAQMSVRHAFLLCGENEAEPLLSTGIAAWQCKRLRGFAWLSPGIAWGAGANLGIRASEFDWGFERGAGAGWRAVGTAGRAVTGSVANEMPPVWRLRPAMLPPMLDRAVRMGAARHVQAATDADDDPVRAAEHLSQEAEAWNAMLAGHASVTLPPRTRRRIIVDLNEYLCAYPAWTASGGAGATLRMHWAESLYEDVAKGRKGNRDEIEGKRFSGVGDCIEFDGGGRRQFDTLWWQAGRYLELRVTTADEALTLEGLVLRETHYPYVWPYRFDCSDARLTAILPLMTRALQMCSHETYMDCPYYEQLMYVGDTRMEALTAYALTGDDRLARKALLMFDASRLNNGLTQSRYPSRVCQVIPPFSLWYVGMVHDWTYWRNEPAFARARLPGVRATIDAWETWINDQGLIENLPSWGFMDWAEGWQHGVPPGADGGVSGSVNLLYVHALRMAAELEEAVGELELAARCRRLAERTATACRAVFFDVERNLFADDPAHRHWSEHAQCLAVLGGVTDEEARPDLERSLMDAQDLTRVTIYFAHYYFEACRMLGRMDAFLARMDMWFDLVRLGFRTTAEQFEPTRSDCHAWGAHPAFHYLATVLGVRPAAPHFSRVCVRPQLGPLAWARGVMPHPQGPIEVDVARRDDRLTGAVILPAGLTGTLIANGTSRPIQPGRNVL